MVCDGTAHSTAKRCQGLTETDVGVHGCAVSRLVAVARPTGYAAGAWRLARRGKLRAPVVARLYEGPRRQNCALAYAGPGYHNTRHLVSL